jgi:acyl carrier protein
MTLETRVRTILSEALKMDLSNMGDNISTKNVPDWDSLAMVNVLLGIEEEFGLEIDGEQIVQLKSFKDIVSLMEELLADEGN